MNNQLRQALQTAFLLMHLLGGTRSFAADVGIPAREAEHQIELRRMIQSVRKTFPAVPQINTTNLAAWLADHSRPAPRILDVREPAEFKTSHLPGARWVSPDSKAEDLVSKLDPNRPVVVYCSVGYRSSKLAERLLNAGFKNVQNLEGSIFAWANEDRPLFRANDAPALQVHPYDARFGRMLKPERRAP